jgi:hypothetical protein
MKMAANKDDLKQVFVTGGGDLEQVVYHTTYSDPKDSEYGFAVAITRPYGAGHRRRVAMRWCDEPGRPLGFPQSSARAVWFEVPDWMEEAVLQAAAQQLAKEIDRDETK